jgi:hypothetical protein
VALFLQLGKLLVQKGTGLLHVVDVVGVAQAALTAELLSRTGDTRAQRPGFVVGLGGGGLDQSHRRKGT